MHTRIIFYIFFIGIYFFHNIQIGHAESTYSSSKATQEIFSELLPKCQKHMIAHTPQYKLLSKKTQDSLEIRQYQLTSQYWSPHELVSPSQWEHTVEIFIPQNPYSHRAFIFVNNGIRHNIDNKPPVQPTDLNFEALKNIAQKTKTIVISISDIPNQYLTYKTDETPSKEDDCVARSWLLFMNNPKEYHMLPLQLPMTIAVSQALTLAQKELTPWKIERFIVSGASKRGMTTWLTAITDSRVDAIVPFVMDMLNIKKALKHMYHVYGNNWPIAFYPYYQHNIDKFLETDEFESLMKIIDPIEYLNSEFGPRLGIPKYIVNASGDDFFVPDNTDYYYTQLPGSKALRVIPNSSHYGISGFTEQSLIVFINRIQKDIPLPQLEVNSNQNKNISLTFSEQPVEVKQWTATNSVSRDFRYACGTRYTSKNLNTSQAEPLIVSLETPDQGWQATFIEAIFSDGFIATTPVYITPNKYPEQAPLYDPENNACKTIPGRVINNNSPKKR